MRKLTILLALIAVMAASATGATAQTPDDVTALACSAPPTPDPDDYNPGTATVNRATAPLRSGPYAECGVRATLQRGWNMTVYCYYKNVPYGNTWFYVSAYPDWTNGWIYYSNVSFTGVISEC
jgi:hypothetical protein